MSKLHSLLIKNATIITRGSDLDETAYLAEGFLDLRQQPKWQVTPMGLTATCLRPTRTFKL